MKYYDWDTEKNEKLKRERGVSFEQVVFHIMQGNELDIYPHPNQEKYPGQRVSVVVMDGYAYLVPRVESDTTIFLKTIIPSRKATRMYVGD